MKSKRIEFENRDGIQLAAYIDYPPFGSAKAFALFAHCFTCSKNLKAVKHISQTLAQKGFGVMRFDFTGLGESDGDFAETNFSSNVEDLIDAANWLGNHHAPPKLIIGHSLGGAAVVHAAAKLPSIEAIATIGAPASPQHVSHLFDEHLEQIKEKGQAKVRLAGRPFTIKSQFIQDLEQHDSPQLLKEMRKPLLILHSPQDNTVGIENAKLLYENAFHPKSFVSLDGADHLLTNEADARYAAEVLTSWASRYVSIDAVDDLPASTEVLARLETEDAFTTQVQMGEHFILADEPEDIGGKDLGPDPYELVSAGLATCTAMTLRMYAARKKWPLEKVEVHIDHDKRHCEDCDEPEKQGKKLDIFTRYVSLFGDLTQEQRQRLLEIANKCPVHKTLSTTSSVKTELREV